MCWATENEEYPKLKIFETNTNHATAVLGIWEREGLTGEETCELN